MTKKHWESYGWQGDRLVALRKASGFTQTELAEAVDCSRRMITYYETESRHPPAGLLVQLAEALNVSTDELLGVTRKPMPQPPSRRVLRRLEKVEQLPKRDQDALLRTIDAFLGKTG